MKPMHFHIMYVIDDFRRIYLYLVVNVSQTTKTRWISKCVSYVARQQYVLNVAD